jgi:sugar phosphate isomerase/epimerase
MRFGIVSSQMKYLIPPGLQETDLINHVFNYNQVDLVKRIAENGFSQIELVGDLGILLPHLYSQGNIELLGELKPKYDLNYTVHLPLWSIEPSTPLRLVREASVIALSQHITHLEQIKPEVYILHATGALAAEFYQMKMPRSAKEYLLHQFASFAKESIARILAETGIPSRKLAIETIEFPFELTLNLAKDLDLSMCFDTGHMLAGFAGPINFFAALELCLPRLAEIHLHDSPHHKQGTAIQYGKDHQALGKGDLNIRKFFDFLIDADFSGPVIFELSIEEANESLELIRTIRPELLTNL